MTDFDAKTPQLKVMKKLMDAYVSLDMNTAGSLMSKNYQYEPLPGVVDIPKEANASRKGRFKEILAVVNKLEVRVQHLRTAFKFTTDIHHP
jgi:hypothetical protein